VANRTQDNSTTAAKYPDKKHCTILEKMTMNTLEYAGFWIRAWASLIDTIFMALIILPLLWWIYGDSYFLNRSVDYGTWDMLMNYVFPPAVVILFWLYKSATPGKMICKLRVVDSKTGGALTTGQCIGRYISYYISGIPVCLGFLWVAFDRRKQGWHDKLAGTVVVHQLPDPVVFTSSTTN
jgi:uncharacterized RDD family membrane protein YckC